MTSSMNEIQDDFEPYDLEPYTKDVTESTIQGENDADFQDDFEPYNIESDDFEPDVADEVEPKKRKLEDLSWYEKNFTSEGSRLQGEKNRNLIKGGISGLTAGFSEAIPGFKVEEGAEGTIGKVAGSLAPITYAAKAISYPLKAMVKVAPKLAKPISSLSSLLGLSAAGGLYEGLEESAEKSIEEGEFVPPSTETVLKQGAKWAALDVALKALGWSGRFAKALYEKSATSSTPVNEILERFGKLSGTDEEVAKKAMSILEETADESIVRRSEDLRNRKIEKKDFNKLEKGAASEPEPYLPSEFNAETIAEEVVSDELTERIEGVSQRATTERELGQNVQADIERNIVAKKAETDELYKIAKTVEGTSEPTLKKTADSIVKQIQKIDSGGLELAPEGYDKAKKQLTKALTDLGYAVETDAEGLIINAVEVSKIPLSQSVEVKRRLNNIINYDLLDTSAQDFLKDPAHELRGEIRTGYGPVDSPARNAFEKGEMLFGEMAEKKGKKAIKNIRMTQNPEAIAKVIRTPSGLADIKENVSKEQFAQVERELLEYLKVQNQDKAASMYRELRPSLTDDARSVAEQVIESKTPLPAASKKEAQRATIQKKAIEDISKATITGERPDTALKLWKTVEGQKLIEHSLKDSPNKSEVLKYLKDQSFKDFYSSVVNPEGVIDFKKLDSMLRDKGTARNVRLVAGEEGLNFLKQLEGYSNRVQKNKSILEGRIDKSSAKERRSIEKEIEKRGKGKIEKIKEETLDLSSQKQKSSLLYKFDDFLNSYGFKAKGVITALGVMKFGGPEAIGAAIGYEIFTSLAKNKSIQKAIRKASIPQSTPAAFISAISAIAEEADKN